MKTNEKFPTGFVQDCRVRLFPPSLTTKLIGVIPYSADGAEIFILYVTYSVSA